MNVAIVDLGCGNVGSVAVGFERLGTDIRLTRDPADLLAAERVVLPGVGAAGFAMERIDALGLRDILTGLDKPLLGICLGMQLLFEASEEDDIACLGLIPGKVRRLEPGPGLPVPHMGWSRLDVREDGAGLRSGDYVYFAHGFAADDGPYSLATAQHGRTIPAVVRKGNLTGAQFHPERSGKAGAHFLRAFLSC
ncbi:imidazole glycerol phosphate synthase subunit HisH [Sphingosinicella sp. CPCC 101087]|uniref:imidazole glycerol phosphate synthase subunit HisH n=1 Tax=Sphingosinicella sp. CPCC 101087 TaxID=2497754 RepID=UPI00101DF411|nr:imidazole glycerol phosphate synthase subunit HisH [Sphingosinicella sp. CPCC 101087]